LVAQEGILALMAWIFQMILLNLEYNRVALIMSVLLLAVLGLAHTVMFLPEKQAIAIISYLKSLNLITVELHPFGFRAGNQT